jgi:hypothetical protein
MFYCLDKHIDEKWLLLYPTLYKEPQKGAFFNVSSLSGVNFVAKLFI